MDEWNEARKFDETNVQIPSEPFVRIGDVVHETRSKGPGGGWTVCEQMFAWPFVPRFSRYNVIDSETGEPCKETVRLTCVTCVAEEIP